MKALIVVDLQNDFAPDGALPVPKGDEIVPIANRLMSRFGLVVATQDWHPANHSSFATQHSKKSIGDVIELDDVQQTLWPNHCVRNSEGAKFIEGLAVEQFDRVFQKGTDARIDSYSGFFDNGHRKATGLGDFLKERGVTDVYVLGLATDYCVKFTALDARELGFETYLVEDGCRGVNLDSDDVSIAINEMRAAGIHVVQSDSIEA